jgi:CheY-like chemotaxis protein
MNKSILLVEDAEHDVIFMRTALEVAQVSNPLEVVGDGEAAIGYLSGKGAFADRQRYPMPGLVLLDLQLPRMPGLEVLKWIRSQQVLARLPVIVCSGSNRDSDVETAYALGANGYIIKPGRPSRLTQIVGTIKKYWLDADGPPPDCQEWLSVIVPPPSSERREQ